MCHRLKMIWVDAKRISAEMIKIEALRNWTYKQFVRNSMCHLHSICVRNNPVGPFPSSGSRSSPDPATSSRMNHELFDHAGLGLTEHAVTT